MIALEGPFSEPRFQQRFMDMWARLDRAYGEVTRATDERTARGKRWLHLEVALPGLGFSLEGTMAFKEAYVRAGGLWRVTEYSYDYHREPRHSGRKTHHWHDGVVHAHCEDPRSPRDVAHFRDVPVRLLEAADEFARIHAAEVVDCSGLFPLD